MQTYFKIWLHYIWTTKNRDRIISKSFKQKLIYHFKEYGKENDIYVDIANGDMDHMHLLIGLKPTQTPAEIANLLKGESSNWINSNNYIRAKFAWQRGYAVFSVSESKISGIRKYILNQDEHHRTKSFKEELDKFIKLHKMV
ncbi:MAG: IS200/IS605 family transposase [Fidelibacterota bacterium]